MNLGRLNWSSLGFFTEINPCNRAGTPPSNISGRNHVITFEKWRDTSGNVWSVSGAGGEDWARCPGFLSQLEEAWMRIC